MTANSQHTVINSQLRNNKKELDLNPQWITAFPTVETPSESGFPITSGKLTGIFWLRLDFNFQYFSNHGKKQMFEHCNPIQGSTEFCREIPVMKTGSLQ
jgi:hypothetical protein